VTRPFRGKGIGNGWSILFLTRFLSLWRLAQILLDTWQCR
jgi:hypothetical protein